MNRLSFPQTKSYFVELSTMNRLSFPQTFHVHYQSTIQISVFFFAGELHRTRVNAVGGPWDVRHQRRDRQRSLEPGHHAEQRGGGRWRGWPQG